MTFSNTAILGLQWGDEGKGKIVNFLAGNFGAACRYQGGHNACLLYTSPSPRDRTRSRMPSSA